MALSGFDCTFFLRYFKTLSVCGIPAPAVKRSTGWANLFVLRQITAKSCVQCMYCKLWLYASVTSRSKRMKGRGEEGHGSRLRVFSPLPSSLLSPELLPSPPLSSSPLSSPPLPCPLLSSTPLSSPLLWTPLLSSPLLPSPLLSSLLVLILLYLFRNIGSLVNLLLIPSLPVPILCTPRWLTLWYPWAMITSRLNSSISSLLYLWGVSPRWPWKELTNRV